MQKVKCIACSLSALALGTNKVTEDWRSLMRHIRVEIWWVSRTLNGEKSILEEGAGEGRNVVKIHMESQRECN